MPELPFIQVLTENLDREVRERTIARVNLHGPSLLKTFEPPLGAIQGRRIGGVRRLAKLVIVDLESDLSLVLHLMRHGRVQIGPPRARGGKDLALGLGLDDGREVRVVELGPKKRASVYVLRTSTMTEVEPIAGLGMDPLDPGFSVERLGAMLAGETTQLKRFLTLQRYVTGIGNAYSDEILWEAPLSPFVRADRLKPAEMRTLHAAIMDTLRRAFEEHRRHFDAQIPTREPLELLRVHRHGGEPCPRCGTPIAEIAYAERETYYCPTCQTGGKVYADRRMSRLLK
ncbi:MAG TPA: DNA-formamidopyrimidine glycosylase family protein [bacterium]|nr:DNA-formamidopyrimidine glycosylase family protein [bacterium]